VYGILRHSLLPLLQPHTAGIDSSLQSLPVCLARLVEPRPADACAAALRPTGLSVSARRNRSLLLAEGVGAATAVMMTAEKGEKGEERKKNFKDCRFNYRIMSIRNSQFSQR
jgi:hypothetical protein